MFICPICGNETAITKGVECQRCEIQRLKRMTLYEHERRLEAVKRYEQAVSRLQQHNYCEDCEHNSYCRKKTRRSRALDKFRYYCQEWKYDGIQEVQQL